MPGSIKPWAFTWLILLSHTLNVHGHVVKHHRKGYHLVEEYQPHDFFDKFSFFQYPDPTNGFVDYISRKEANETGLIKVHKNHTHPTESHAYVGVDHTNVYNLAEGRKSVRLQSHKTFTRGLFVLSLDHMPHGCGTWPAWWTVGPHWPYTGEIDIIEGVNKNRYNLMSLHTGDGCTIAGAKQKGLLITNDCNSVQENVGCGVLRNSSKSFGRGFNTHGGGVYAMEWTASHIKVWQWQHDKVPKNLQNGNPDPTTFGTPLANLAGSCNINQHFRDHSIVFDMTFCGDYAGYKYGQTDCPLANLGHLGCNKFVAQNPSAFKDAFWKIRSMHVYQKHGSDVDVYHPPKYSSIVPVVSTAPQSASSFIPPPLGHKTTITTTRTRKPSATTSHSTTLPTSTSRSFKTTHVATSRSTIVPKPTRHSTISTQTTTTSISTSHKVPFKPTATTKPSMHSALPSSSENTVELSTTEQATTNSGGIGLSTLLNPTT